MRSHAGLAGPIDTDTLLRCSRESENGIITVEDHWPEGGLGEAVLHAVTERAEGDTVTPPLVKIMGVQSMPTSGTPDELLHAAGIDADAIVAAVQEMTGGGS